ncbi:MAG: LysM peptidoglycan-binding domain-containing protein [Anaerocolumna aminovalerica]|jgi:spore germination protein|uniref:LysM peptidoglycan-binding domain-containing protein n=1 Tax=Anaerocolumna aminovalerica TaxID=1527 RepID=UPI0029074501|nr:LysM peptidoglycan-binding domain-containing protein [Anaerocolumna aminovalerica]MDU6266577.1 LysM peptidoglycan-binding domain-containing protein [Anaerocolumna aminovalerica]
MIIHVVQPGETITSIAELYNLPADRIILENEIKNPSNLAIGQTIVIVYPLLTHTVQEGETLESIAVMHDVTIMQILRNNPYLSDRNNLYTGETITITNETDKIGSLSVGGYVSSYVDRNILRKTLPFLTFLTVFDYRVDANGNINVLNDQDIVNMAKEYGVFPMMLVSTISERGVGSLETALAILNNPDAQDNMIDNIIATIKAKGFYGLNQYFQYIYPETKNLIESFIIKMSTRLKNEGLRYTVTVTPRVDIERTEITYETIDYSAIYQYVDAILLLSYEWGYSLEPPTSVTPINIVREIINQAVNMAPPDKFVLGMPVIGYDWELPYIPGYTVANAITFDIAIQIAADNGVPIQFSEVAAASYFFYYNVDGTLHNIWFKDARSIDRLTRLIPEYGLQGVSIWNNMYFFAQMWLVINNLYDIEKLEF